MPDNGKQPYYYRISNFLAEVIVINTEESYYKGSEQYAWIEEQLKSIDHSSKWIIICGHRPMYSSVKVDYLQSHSLATRKHLEALFHKYEVDIAFWGHIHNYERTCPLFNMTCAGTYDNPKGTVHIVTGAGGLDLLSDFETPPPALSEFRTPVFGYVTISIPNRAELTVKYVQASDGTILDQATLRSKHQRTTWFHPMKIPTEHNEPQNFTYIRIGIILTAVVVYAVIIMFVP